MKRFVIIGTFVVAVENTLIGLAKILGLEKCLHLQMITDSGWGLMLCGLMLLSSAFTLSTYEKSIAKLMSLLNKLLDRADDFPCKSTR